MPPRRQLAPLRKSPNVHRLQERFIPAVYAVATTARIAELRDTFFHLADSTSAGMSWLDALVYERIFVDKVVAANPIPEKTPDGLTVWVPTVHALEQLVALLKHQESLRQRCIRAVVKRQRIVERLLMRTCFAARQVEAREKELRRSTVLESHPPRDGTWTIHDLWPKDVVRLFLHRCSANGSFDPCLQHVPRVACSWESHQRMAELLAELDAATDEVVTLVLEWRLHLYRPQPFVFHGNNVLLMIQNELETVVASMTAHLVDQAGGQALYDPQHCSFHYVSRYLGGFAVAPKSSSRRHGQQRQPQYADPASVSKTLLYTVTRELQVQMKLVQEGLKLADEAHHHITPLLPCRYIDRVSGSTPQETASTVVGLLPTTDVDESSLPAFVIDARGDPYAVRRHVLQTSNHFCRFPVVVQVPKRWFPSEELLKVVREDVAAAVAAEVQLQRSGGVVGTRDSFSAAESTTGATSESRRDQERRLTKLRSSPSLYRLRVNPGSVPPENSQDSAYVYTVVIDHRGLLTRSGLYYVLHREIERDPLVESQVFQWLHSCYQHGRVILEEPFGTMVEPILQRQFNDQREASALEEALRQRCLEDGTEFTRSRLREVLAAARRAKEEELRRLRMCDVDFGNDATMDRLVLLLYGEGYAVPSASPVPCSDVAVGDGVNPEAGGTDSEDGEAKDHKSIGPSAQDTSPAVPSSSPTRPDAVEVHQRLVMLQRRTTKRFALRILRSWVRFHLNRLQRREMTLDLLSRNTKRLVRRRFSVWVRLVQRRRLLRRRADLLSVQSLRCLMHRRFVAWRVAHLFRAVAKNFNQWLYRTSYFRWLQPVLKRRTTNAVKLSPEFPWMTALATISFVVGSGRTAPNLRLLYAAQEKRRQLIAATKAGSS